MSVASSGPRWADRYTPDADGPAMLQEPGGDSPALSFAAIRGIVLRQGQLIIAIVVIALVIGLVVTLLTRPQYEASSTVVVDPNTARVVEGQDIEGGVAPNEMLRYLKTESAIIKSERMAYRVVDALKLADRNDFFGDDAPDRKLTEAERKSRRATAAAMLRGALTVGTSNDTAVVTITYSSFSPEYAALVANSYADNYVLEGARTTIETNANAQKIIQEQIAKLRVQLQDAELQANAYAKANGIVGAAVSSGVGDSATSSGQTITAANLASVNASLTELRTKRIEAEQRWRAIENVPATRLPEVQQNAMLQPLVAERSKTIAELSQLRQRYGETYPRIRELTAQVAALESQINRISTDIKTAARDQYLIAKRQEDGLASELTKASGATLEEQDKRVRYGLLDRNAAALRTQLAALLDRYNQLAAASNFSGGKASKLDSAHVPGGPSSPDLVKNMLVAFALGLVAAGIAAVLREFLDDRLRSPEEVERKLGYPMLGFTPAVEDEKLASQMADPFSSLMEAYSSIRTSVDFAVPGDHRVLNVTSSQPSEGKSLSSLVLARKYASLGFKTLVIDADMRRPGLSYLASGKRPPIGFVEVLLGDVTLDRALLSDTTENLHVLPIAGIPNNPVELLSSARLREFTERLREEYQMVIFDTPPVIGLADSPLMSRLVDATVFVVEANRAHFGQAKVALRRLRAAGANIAGVVLTKYRADTDGSYYYNHSYYYQYGDGQKSD